MECRQWDEFVLKIEFYALNLSCIMRIDVKGFVQWGCVSDIKYPDYHLIGDLSFYVKVFQYHFPLQFDC